MALHPPHEKEQIRAIEICLATARDYVQDDLRNYITLLTEPYEKVGLDDSIFEFAELVGYRINNSALEIAKDLELEERYGLINDQPVGSVGRAFRGHNNEDFLPDYQLDGLFSEEMNDMIERIRYEMNGREKGHIGGRASVETHGDQMRNGYANSLANLTPKERSEHSRKGYANGLGNLTSKELSEHSRKGNETQGNHLWSLEEIVDIHNFREESIGKGYRKNQPSLDYVRDKMNEKYEEDWKTKQVNMAYDNNKHLLADKEE
jgi:hypothetical protein